jgi:hypothetical protein
MAEPSSHINYSFEDIQRYLQGKMSATEMHDIEKAALQDSFLADAIEGFDEADFTTAKQHLKEINAGLFAEKKKSKVVPFNKRTQWLNVAAIIIVLAAVGAVTSYFVLSSNKQTAIAKTQQEPGKHEVARDSQSVTDNVNAATKKPDTNVLIAANKAVKKVQPPAAKKKAAENISEDKTMLKQDNSAVPNDEVSTLAVVPEEKTMMSRSFGVTDTQAQLQGKVSGVSVLPSLPSTFSGKVMDQNGEPIAGVTITSSDKKTAVITDINGNFNLQQTDTVLNVTAGTVGYNSRNVVLKKGINDPVILNQTNETLTEVVVTGYGTNRKKNVSLSRNQNNTAVDSAMPVGGWSNFNNYVITQLNSDTTSNTIANPDDVVEMEFLIDKAGNPYNIKITRSVNGELSSKAVELLKNGPKWTTPGRKKKVHVVINF